MEINLEAIKEIWDLGAVTAIAFFLSWCWYKKLSSIEEKMIKILTLLTVLIKTQTKFNHIDSILGKDKEKVKDELSGTGIK